MTGLIRTAYASHTQPEAAIRLCQAQLGMEAPDLILAFVGGRHMPASVRAALQASFGNVPLTGGSAAGAISTTGFGYSGFEIGLTAFKGADVTPSVLAGDGLATSEAEAGRALGQKAREHTADGAAVVLLFDSVASSTPLRLHSASRIMEGFQAGLNDRRLHVIGGGLLTDINLSDGWLFCEGEVRKHAMVALVFPPGLRASTTILHGCRPVSTFMEITRIEGAEVLELNHEPALTVVERMLGLALGTASGQQLSLVATLGQKQGDPFAPYDETQYVNRLILHANPRRGSITLSEPDFAVGTRVQIMSRDNALVLESAQRGVARLKQEIGAAPCALALYIDCAGRASIMSGADSEEAEIVLRTLAPDFPFMGFYSGVEIAPFAGHDSRPFDWTGVLTILQYAA
jgi:hypothetical protein